MYAKADIPTESRPPCARLRPARPGLGGARAFRIFCKPSRSSHRAPDHDQLVARARFHLRTAARQVIATRAGQSVVHIFEPEGPPLASVLVVHGWTAEAAFMTAFADFLRRRGFRCVLPDLPAHGQSPGRHTSLIAGAVAVRDIAEATGPIRFVLGHSMGGLAALAAGEGHAPLPGGYPFEAYVLVSTPDRFSDVTRRFADEHGLDRASLRAFERRLARLAQRPVAEFTGSRLLAHVARPALVLHARDDREVPFADAERVAAALPGTELQAFDGLGHRMILYTPAAVRAAAAFLQSRV